jgi:predicted nuclease of predicted toxin-antitoxin system
MRLQLDENMPVTAAALLSARGYDTDTVRDEGRTGHPDDAVWRSTQAEARFLVTQVLNFSDTRKFAPGTHHGILLVRLPDSEQWRVNDYLVARFSDPDAGDWARCVVVATPTTVRVIRPVVTDD